MKLAHGDLVSLGAARVRLRVNPRARRISLRLDLAGEAVATAPDVRSLPQALDFARERAGWIEDRLARRPAATALQPGGSVPLRGSPTLLLASGTAGAARLAENAIVSGGQGEAFARRVLRLLKREALADAAAAVARHAATLERSVPPVSVINARTRWGSCTPGSGRIRLNWRLILAPPAVLDYVAAHEVAHLVEANHSPRFWAVVERLYGDPADTRAWLRTNGAALQSIGLVIQPQGTP